MKLMDNKIPFPFFGFGFEWKLPSIRLWLPLWLSWSRIHLHCGRLGFDPWVGKIPWRRARLPTPVFLPREFHGPWGHKESDMIWQLNNHNAQELNNDSKVKPISHVRLFATPWTVAS